MRGLDSCFTNYINITAVNSNDFDIQDADISSYSYHYVKLGSVNFLHQNNNLGSYVVLYGIFQELISARLTTRQVQC